MNELFKSRGVFILGDLQYISHNVNYKSGEITLDNNTISFQYDNDKSFHRLKVVEIKHINYLPEKSNLELIDILGLIYRYAPTSVADGKTVIDKHKLDILAKLALQVQAQSTPIIIESEFQLKQIQKGRGERVILEREIREEQQFKEQMEIIFSKLRNEKVKKLAKILSASNALNIDIVMEVLKIDSSTFYSDIFPIAVDYGFKLDGDIMNFKKKSIPEFIYKLTNYFFIRGQKGEGQKLTIKKPKPKKKAGEVLQSVPLSAEELEEEKKVSEVMEKEVTVQREKFICVVHKGPIEGDNYLCPNCFTFYCMRCALTLKNQGEACWTCGTEIDIKAGPSLPLEILQEVKKLEVKMNTLKKTANDLDESFYAGAIESEEYKKIKDSIVEKILTLSSEIAQMKSENVNRNMNEG